jgi:hypothetical protein
MIWGIIKQYLLILSTPQTLYISVFLYVLLYFNKTVILL